VYYSYADGCVHYDLASALKNLIDENVTLTRYSFVVWNGYNVAAEFGYFSCNYNVDYSLKEYKEFEPDAFKFFSKYFEYKSSSTYSTYTPTITLDLGNIYYTNILQSRGIP